MLTAGLPAGPDGGAGTYLPRYRRAGTTDIWALTDGIFHPKPSYFSSKIPAANDEGLFTSGGALEALPLGCYLIRDAAGHLILVDAGLGPVGHACTSVQEEGDLASHGFVQGGLLPDQFAAIGIDPADVNDVILTHPHTDHVGWLGHPGTNLFSNARVLLGEADFHYFQSQLQRSRLLQGLDLDEIALIEAQQHTLADLHAGSVLTLVPPEKIDLRPGVSLFPTPGHTPGHSGVSVTTGRSRFLFIGDAITCPHQEARPSWHSVGDINPDQAAMTRRSLWAEAKKAGTTLLGSHFPPHHTATSESPSHDQQR